MTDSTEAQVGANIQYRQIGRPLVRTDAPGKTFGATPYAGDYVMPNMLHVKVLRSPLASARLKRLDAAKARALDGVACVLTAAELPDRLAATDIPGQTGRKRLDTDQQILVRERVRYHGEPLALIAAETSVLAERAADWVVALAPDCPSWMWCVGVEELFGRRSGYDRPAILTAHGAGFYLVGLRVGAR